MSGTELLLYAMIHMGAGWESSTSEFCFNGTRHLLRVNASGLPVITRDLRVRINQAKAKSRAG